MHVLMSRGSVTLLVVISLQKIQPRTNIPTISGEKPLFDDDGLLWVLTSFVEVNYFFFKIRNNIFDKTLPFHQSFYSIQHKVPTYGLWIDS